MYELDHIVLAAPDLDAAKLSFSEQTGVMPIDGGPHEGRGTRNALVSFDNGAYLEIIAPDPEQSLDGTRGESFAQLGESRLLHWAVRVDDLQQVADKAKAAGLTPKDVFQMSRRLPDGTLLEWELMGLGGHDLRGCAPFFIDWLKSPHPSETAPKVGDLTLFQIDVPAASPLARFLDAASAGVTLAEGPESMTLSIESPEGPVSWTTESPAGFEF